MGEGGRGRRVRGKPAGRFGSMPPRGIGGQNGRVRGMTVGRLAGGNGSLFRELRGFDRGEWPPRPGPLAARVSGPNLSVPAPTASSHKVVKVGGPVKSNSRANARFILGLRHNSFGERRLSPSGSFLRAATAAIMKGRNYNRRVEICNIGTSCYGIRITRTSITLVPVRPVFNRSPVASKK